MRPPDCPKERAALKDNKAVGEWAKKWAEANLDKDRKKRFGSWVINRLRRGTKALDMALLDKLVAIKDREFATQTAIDGWLSENGIEGDVRKKVLGVVPTTKELGHDLVVCLDAATGKTVWKKKFPGQPRQYGSSSTPCVADGRVYVIGSDSAVYCLKADTGEKVWQGQVNKGTKECSFAVADGVAVIPAGPLTGFDAETGSVLWSQPKIGAVHSSPAVWRKDGKAYFLCRASDRTVVCVDPESGDVLWRVGKYQGDSTPAIVGDTMVIWHNHGVTAHRLGLEKAEELWTVKTFNDYAASPVIYEGHVYIIGSKGALCINLADGKILWEKTKVGPSYYTSPVVADGKMFVQTETKFLLMLKATPAGCEVLGKAAQQEVAATSAAFADGRMYVRLVKRVACYDLRKKAD